MRPVSNYIKHMLDEANFLIRKSSEIEKASFLSEDTLKRAFARSIEILGEAAKQIPSEITIKYPEAEWNRIARMRDRLIHGYFSVDYELVWDVAVSKMPRLKPILKHILEIEKN